MFRAALAKKSGVGLSRTAGKRVFASRGRRYFSEQAKTASKEAKPEGTVHASPPPPPPPTKGGGGNGVGIFVVAALGGAAYYFWDEISEKVGLGKSSNTNDELPEAVPNVPETKAEITKIEAKVEEIIKEEAKTVKETGKKALTAKKATEPAQTVDWTKLREEIVNILDEENHDDGSYGPILVRLAWHQAGTYNKNTGKGGTEGAGMRFTREASWGANAGLDVARAILEPIKAKFPGVTYSDLWSFAGTVAIEEMGGPEMKWRPGRKDCVEDDERIKIPDGMLPDADGRSHITEPQKHVREIFNRMGFNDQEMVCLLGAHALGRCHEKNSGYWGPWTFAPTTFSNEYFRLLVDLNWTKKETHQGKKWTGPEQYENTGGESGNAELMMLPTDMCLVWDDKFKKYVELYAKDEERFMKDFAKAWMKLQENGVRAIHGWRRYYLFGPRE